MRRENRDDFVSIETLFFFYVVVCWSWGVDIQFYMLYERDDVVVASEVV